MRFLKVLYRSAAARRRGGLQRASQKRVDCEAHLRPINPPAPVAKDTRGDAAMSAAAASSRATSRKPSAGMPTAARRRADVVRLALGVAGAGWITVLALAAALMLLMPLKRVEPFVVRVDNTTGVVDVVPVYAGNAAMPEADHPVSAHALRDGV